MATQLTGPVMPIRTVSDSSCKVNLCVCLLMRIKKADDNLFSLKLLASFTWTSITEVMTDKRCINSLNILHYSSQMMTNLRNLCISLMKHLNPFSDDCCSQK